MSKIKTLKDLNKPKSNNNNNKKNSKLDTINNQKKGREYEDYVVDCYKKTGHYNHVWLYKHVPNDTATKLQISNTMDKGFDILAIRNDSFNFIQCKNFEKTITNKDLSGFLLFMLNYKNKSFYDKKTYIFTLCYSNTLSRNIKSTLPDTILCHIPMDNSFKINIISSTPPKKSLINNSEINTNILNKSPTPNKNEDNSSINPKPNIDIATSKTDIQSVIESDYDTISTIFNDQKNSSKEPRVKLENFQKFTNNLDCEKTKNEIIRLKMDELRILINNHIKKNKTNPPLLLINSVLSTKTPDKVISEIISILQIGNKVLEDIVNTVFE